LKKKTDKTKQTCATKEEIQELKNQVQELTNLLKRVQADYENYKKRVEKDKDNFKEYSKSEVVKKILPVLDSLELSLKQSPSNQKEKSPEHHESIKGFELIYSQLRSTLQDIGLQPIVCEGLPFDSNYHEVMLTQKCNLESEDEIIVEELQRGYMFSGKVIRASKVKINKK
jgi:molecular chaperone GrpE